MADKKQLTPFGREVKIRLIEKCISQRELAENVGTTESYLCQILYGLRTGEKYMPQIAKILGIDLEGKDLQWQPYEPDILTQAEIDAIQETAEYKAKALSSSLQENKARRPAIRFLRTTSEKLDSLTLFPGEPLINLDTGKLYIGLENGTKVCVNP